MREVKFAFVNVVDNTLQSVGAFIYLDGQKVNADSDLCAHLEEVLPTDCLNEVSLEDVMPEKLKALAKQTEPTE